MRHISKNDMQKVVMKTKRICVFCGSRAGRDSSYEDVAKQLGQGFAKAGIGLVYGGGSVGLMGITARAALQAGGEVIGIIPKFLDELEVAQENLTKLEIVDTMHERKALMFSHSDAFVVLPGGIGSLEEVFEVATWAQLRLHSKPIFLFNHKGYWEPLVDLVEHVIAHGFADSSARRLFEVVGDFDELMEALNNHHDDAVQHLT